MGVCFLTKVVNHPSIFECCTTCTTCKDARMVDYLLLSPNIINIITDFEIIDFNPMFSDVHNLVHLTLTVKGENNQHYPIDNPNINPRVRWRSHKVNEFIQVINDDPHNTLNEINNTLNELCQKNQIEDEYHYIFECTNLSEKRTSLLPKHLIERPNIIKFKILMTSERKPILQKLCKFIRYMNMIVCPPG